MLRTVFVLILILIGIVLSLYGSLNALMFYLWVAYFRPESWIWSSFLKGSGLSRFVGIFLIISTLITNIKFRFTFFSFLLILAAIHSFMSTELSKYSSYSFPYWIDFIKVVVISYLITMLIKSEKELKIVLIVISLSLGLEAAKQGWVNLILRPGGANMNNHPVLGDNNGVAVGMFMLVPILLAIYKTTEQKLIKFGFAFLAIGITYRGLSTYSRGGLLSFLTICFIFWLQSKYKFKSLLVIVLLSALILPAFPQKFWDRMSTITDTGDEMDSSVSGRLYFWSVAWNMAKDKPLFGVGHFAYQAAYNDYDYSGIYGQKRAVHSAWFGVLAEWGIVGLILYLYIYLYSLFSCAKARKICNNIPEYSQLKIYCNSIEISLIAGCVGISFLTLQYLEFLWHFFALAVVTKQILMNKIATHDALINDSNESLNIDKTMINGSEFDKNNNNI